MFKDTIFDNTKVVKQNYSYQYIDITWPLNYETEMTVNIYDRIVKVMSDTSSMWDIGLE